MYTYVRVLYRTQIYIKRKFEICSKCFSTQFLYFVLFLSFNYCSAQTSCFILKHVNTGRKLQNYFNSHPIPIPEAYYEQ